MWKAIGDNLNSLDGFKVHARAVRERYGVIKAHIETKEREEKRASEISPEVTLLDTTLEELLEGEKDCTKNLEVKDKKANEYAELVRSIRQEVFETFAETKTRKLNEDEEDTGPSARRKSRSSGSAILTFLKEKIKKKER